MKTNEFILRCRLGRAVAAGLFEKYLRDALGKDIARAESFSKGRVLRLEDFATHFLILASGLIVSAVSFSIRYLREKAASRKRKSVTPLKSPSPEPLEFFVDSSNEYIRNRSNQKIRFIRLAFKSQHYYQLY